MVWFTLLHIIENVYKLQVNKKTYKHHVLVVLDSVPIYIFLLLLRFNSTIMSSTTPLLNVSIGGYCVEHCIHTIYVLLILINAPKAQ